MDEMEFVTKAISEKSVSLSILSPVSEKIYHIVQISKLIRSKLSRRVFLKPTFFIRKITFLWEKN